ncbi:MAG: haloacid dehalogenase type II [Candidatus Latescibacteria bacterium]|nr:haloacid dehalogenase type II [Candidatus Latescibacterota bacterium]
MTKSEQVQALTFDLFGTILDLGGSLTPFIDDMLREKGSDTTAEQFWQQWRYRQRLEQFQDTIMMLGHGGYLETVRRAFVYVLALNKIEMSKEEVQTFLACWQELSPFPEVRAGLEKLAARYKLVGLSNGDPVFLDHLAKNRIQWDFDDVISVTTMGAFKPHPAVYRRAAQILGLEVGECMMVSANSFDVVGARACGLRGAYVNRYDLPYEDSPYRADVTVANFTELAEAIA